MYEILILKQIPEADEECAHHRLGNIARRAPPNSSCHGVIDEGAAGKVRVRFEVRAPEGFYRGEAQAADAIRAMEIAEAQLSAELARGKELFEESADSLGIGPKVA